MLHIILYAIASASRPDSTIPLTKKYTKCLKPEPPPYHKPVIRKNVRKWRGIFEHKDTPLHKS
jgi:hypothetical protein